MKAGRIIWLPFAFLIFVGNLALAKPALAATPNSGINLQISPLPIELSVKPGESISTDLRVRNGGNQTEKLQVRVLKVTEDDNGLVHFSEPQKTDEWASWISFSRTVIDAPPNDWQTVHMTVNLPKDAAFGYYFAVEYLRASAELPQPGQAVARGAVATFILLSADNPNAKREAKVVSFTASHKLYEFLPINFVAKIRSTGNVHVAAHGNVFINKGSKQVGSVEINAAQGNVLPASSRYFSTGWDDGFPHYEAVLKDGQAVLDKKGQPVRSLRWDFSKVNRLRFGHYSAHLFMIYDNGQRDVPIEASLSFWVVPWRILGGLLLIVLLGMAGLWAILRPLVRRLPKNKKRA